MNGRLVETRLLEKRREPDDGGWFQMSYAWLDDESDAVAVPEGVTNVRGTTYEIPAQRDCRSCHYHGEKPIIGISALQLSTTADGSDSPSMASLLERGWLSAAPTRRYTPPGTGVVQDALGERRGNDVRLQRRCVRRAGRRTSSSRVPHGHAGLVVRWVSYISAAMARRSPVAPCERASETVSSGR